MLIKQVLKVFMNEPDTSGCKKNLMSLVELTKSQTVYPQGSFGSSLLQFCSKLCYSPHMTVTSGPLHLLFPRSLNGTIKSCVSAFIA